MLDNSDWKYLPSKESNFNFWKKYQLIQDLKSILSQSEFLFFLWAINKSYIEH